MYELPSFDPASAIRISEKSGQAAACREMILHFLNQ
jgi:hypothetical protein